MSLVDTIDELLQAAYPADEPGAAVIAVQDGRTIFRKGYGLAQVEFGIPIDPDVVFRLGSITKQFTAVAILMLMEQGLLTLDDSITRFLPDYPTHGHTITTVPATAHLRTTQHAPFVLRFFQADHSKTCGWLR
jgi:CubicO group peptidase (beta-lactamase class C family)